jgi:hypothetical protein
MLPGKVAMEAVSPILSCRGTWESEIDRFWKAMRAVFHMPERSTRCGSHIHVSAGSDRTFKLAQLKTIAYGIILYEPLFLQLLMADRSNNTYCTANSRKSTQLMACNGNRAAIARLIDGASTKQVLKGIMQDSRYVLWNFENIVPLRSGSVEFRGGRVLRGEIRTKRWIAFTIAFIHMLLEKVVCLSVIAYKHTHAHTHMLMVVLLQNDLQDPSRTSLSEWSPQKLYEAIKNAATQLSLRNFLPDDHRVLNETRR